MSGEAALAAIWERTGANLPVDSDRRRHGGMPVFNGSRVPARFLLDLLKQGENIEEFLSRYTSVEREYAVRVLDLASDLVEAVAYCNADWISSDDGLGHFSSQEH